MQDRVKGDDNLNGHAPTAVSQAKSSLGQFKALLYDKSNNNAELINELLENNTDLQDFLCGKEADVNKAADFVASWIDCFNTAANNKKQHVIERMYGCINAIINLEMLRLLNSS